MEKTEFTVKTSGAYTSQTTSEEARNPHKVGNLWQGKDELLEHLRGAGVGEVDLKLMERFVDRQFKAREYNKRPDVREKRKEYTKAYQNKRKEEVKRDRQLLTQLKQQLAELEQR